MGNLIYQPLLREGFQEVGEVTPSDISQLQAQITELGEDVSNKVPKFFTNIEELQIGEIGEYQGDTTTDFTNGYFYKRRSSVAVSQTLPQYSWSASQYLDIKDKDENLVVRQYMYHDIIIFPKEKMISCYCGVNARCLIFATDFLVNSNFDTVTLNNIDYYLFPYAIVAQSANSYYVDFDNPIKYLGDNTVKYLDNEPYQLYRAGYDIPCRVGADLNDPSKLYGWFGTAPCLPFLISSDFNTIGFDGVIPFPYGFYYYTALQSLVPITALQQELNAQLPFTRVDTQPTTDTTRFATAEQGDKADTALQSIAKGTDGSYITTNVGAKNANNAQTVSATLTMQAIANADADHKGLAEAKDVKDYVDTYINNITIAQYDTLNDYYTLTLPTA